MRRRRIPGPAGSEGPTGPTGPAGPAGPGGSSDPWNRQWFVNPGFSGSGTPNGSPGLPFLTAQDAVDAAAEGDTIVLSFGNAGDVDLGEKNIAFQGIGGSVLGNMAILGAVTGTGDPTQATFTDCMVASITLPTAYISLNTCHVVSGGIECSGLSATQTMFTFGADAHIICSDGGSPSQFIDCQFFVSGEVVPEYRPGDASPAAFDRVSALSFQDAGWKYLEGDAATAPLDLEPNTSYGDGSDGSLAAGFGTVSLTRDTYYHNVSFQAGDSIEINGYRLCVDGVLDLRGADSSAILVTSNGNVTGINASGSTAGVAAPDLATGLGTLPPSAAGGAGGAGGNVGGAGTSSSAIGQNNIATIGGIGGSGGSGGAASGAGGKGGVVTSAGQTPTFLRRMPGDFLRPFTAIILSCRSGTGGGGGSGGATGKGGGGGGTPFGGSAGQIFARVVVRDATTDAEAIDAGGLAGGNGGDGTTDGAGGGGGSGCGGSAVSLIHDWLLGEETTCVYLDGGPGGRGGDGAGGAAGGNGGPGASSGVFLLGNAIRNLWTATTSVAGSAGDAASGSTGGNGGAGGASSADI